MRHLLQLVSCPRASVDPDVADQPEKRLAVATQHRLVMPVVHALEERAKAGLGGVPPDEVRWARRVIEAMGDGTGAVMIDGKMQDDATYKQCKVVVDLADALAATDPELAAAYAAGAGDE